MLQLDDLLKSVSPGKISATIDATGFETIHATPYYTYRCNLRNEFTIMSVGSVHDLHNWLMQL